MKYCFRRICQKVHFLVIHQKTDSQNLYPCHQKEFEMPSETVCKIVRQYNKMPVSPGDMEKLKAVAEDYGRVKSYVYQRYGGIRSLPKLYPGYTAQNEMTASGLREELGLPSVYFYLAVFEALTDIRNQWVRTKAAVLENVNQNTGLTAEEKHFLRYLLKVNNGFEAALNQSPLRLPKDIKRQYETLAVSVDVKKLESYLRRQVRKCHKKLSAGKQTGFSMTERAYRYGDHGIYISTKEKRNRIFIPLTDTNTYTRQIELRLYPEDRKIELRVPVNMAVKKHSDYKSHVGIALGMKTMAVTDQGNRYGEELEVYQSRLADWLREQNRAYSQNRKANPGRKKYYAKKRRMEEQLHGYINQEWNRFLQTEKPETVYIPRLPKSGTAGPIKKINHYSSMWQRGYIRQRLAQKCREQSIELVEVYAKDISRECGRCGNTGEVKGEIFRCLQCGYEVDRKQNTARNTKRRGQEGKTGGQTRKRS